MSARDKARRGEFPLGKKTREMLLQELWSLHNTKPMFRSSDHHWKVKQKVKELNKLTGQMQDSVYWLNQWNSIFRPNRKPDAVYRRVEAETKKTKKRK